MRHLVGQVGSSCLGNGRLVPHGKQTRKRRHWETLGVVGAQLLMNKNSNSIIVARASVISHRRKVLTFS